MTPQVHPLLVFKARAEAWALLVYAGEFNPWTAIEVMLDDAFHSGLIDQVGDRALFAIIRAAFRKYEDGVRENERSE